MANLRIIYNNIADTATIQASSTASGFSTENLKNTRKSSIHRSSANTAAYTLSWSSAQSVSSIALPATNLLAGDTILVQLYTETADTSPVATSGVLQACTGKSVLLPENVTSFNYVQFTQAMATKTSVWFSQVYTVKKIIITLVSNKPIDCSRIICGVYWESARQASNGITLSVNDSSEVAYTRSGDIYTDKRYLTENLTFDLQYLYDADRVNLLNIYRKHGSSALVYLCVFPDNSNPETTQSYSIYGRIQPTSITYQLYSLYNTSLDIVSW